MATYKEIKGVTVQTRAEDPTVNVGSWASGGNLNQTSMLRAGFGTQTAAYACGGEGPPGAAIANVENYNGSAWSETTDLNTGRTGIQGGGDGSATAGIVFAGETPGSGGGGTNLTETWNGSSWTEVAELNTPRRYMGSTTSGGNTAVLAFGGLTGSPDGPTVNNEQWNGSAWTETGDLNTGRYAIGGFGTTTAAIAAGGGFPNKSEVESWDGSSWTEISDIATARRGLGSSGSSTDGLVFGGDNPSKNAQTESFDGTSFTEVNDLSTARAYGATGGITSATEALFAGGQTLTNITEDWSFPSGPHLNEGDIFLSGGGTTLKGFGKAAGIPAGTWGSGTNLPTANRSMGIFGPSTSTIIGGGYEPGGSATNAYSWNGSSWSDIAELNANKNEGVGYGNSSTSGFINKGTNEEWDGSSWTERNDLNTARQLSAASGSSTAGLITGGEVNPSAVTETWDGTNWTEVGDTNEGRYGGALSGTQTAAIFAGGVEYPGGSKVASAETWNGTSWTEGNNLNEGRSRTGYSSKSVGIAMVFGGENPSNANSAKTEIYNGTSWTEINDMSSARRSTGAGISGSAAAGSLAVAGTPPTVATVEEWSVDNALATITFS